MGVKTALIGAGKMGTYYHVTDVKNLDSIFSDGLVPSIGPLSEQLGETGELVPAVYLFTSDEACRDAMSGWLGAAFDELDGESGEESRHAVLRVELGDGECGEDDGEFYEKAVYDVIPPERLSICANLMCDFDYDEKWFDERYGKYVR